MDQTEYEVGVHSHTIVLPMQCVYIERALEGRGKEQMVSSCRVSVMALHQCGRRFSHETLLLVTKRAVAVQVTYRPGS